ncbi:MAG: hybrid sensor histidine kinase/response regulator [Deltaproteobacteria bacterium]|nr:MAG: hybrid sensor histidine kinase/response regulator [Deltaproteobacteria bacterium]
MFSKIKVKVLLIEDDEGDAFFLEELFAGHASRSISLHWCKDLAEGLEALQQQHFDVVLLDLSLPDSIGLDTFLRVQEQAPSLPVVVLSGLDDDDVAIHAVEEGAQDYLIKGKVNRELLVRSLHYGIKRKQVEEELRLRTQALEDANKELRAFSYTVSHDLRTPLRSIHGFAQLLERGPVGKINERGRHFVRNIVEASTQMERLISDLLKFARLGQQSVVLEDVSLDSLLSKVAEKINVQLKEVGGRIKVFEHSVSVRGHEVMLQQIFFNLFENAITYRQPERPLELVVTCEANEPDSGNVEAGKVVVRVEDNGLGIEEKFHQKIFAMFQRLHHQEDYPGTGIGLATVKKSVELMGGKVWVESELGKGSIFCIELPNI